MFSLPFCLFFSLSPPSLFVFSSLSPFLHKIISFFMLFFVSVICTPHFPFFMLSSIYTFIYFLLLPSVSLFRTFHSRLPIFTVFLLSRIFSPFLLLFCLLSLVPSSPFGHFFHLFKISLPSLQDPLLSHIPF